MLRFRLGEIGLYIGAAILAALLVLFFAATRRRPRGSQQNACINNLRIIDTGKEQWAMAQQKTDGDPVVIVGVNEYIKGNTTPVCPGGGRYVYGTIGSNPECRGVTATRHALPTG